MLYHLIAIDKAIFDVCTKTYAHFICMHEEKAAVLSKALQACILWILRCPVHVY